MLILIFTKIETLSISLIECSPTRTFKFKLTVPAEKNYFTALVADISYTVLSFGYYSILEFAVYLYHTCILISILLSSRHSNESSSYS